MMQAGQGDRKSSHISNAFAVYSCVKTFALVCFISSIQQQIILNNITIHELQPHCLAVQNNVGQIKHTSGYFPVIKKNNGQLIFYRLWQIVKLLQCVLNFVMEVITV